MRAATVVLIAVSAHAAFAETAMKVQSCSEAATAMAAYRTCMAANPRACRPPRVSQCWDFEEGLGNAYFGWWAKTGTAFDTQPTWGDNVWTSRVLYGASKQQLLDIGGDYWESPYPIGHQGDYWLGTYEARRNANYYWASTQGDGPTGVAYSPAFVIDRNYVMFLIGGGCDQNTVYVELQVSNRGRFTRAYHADGSAYVRTGSCSELLTRNGWLTDAASGMQGKTVRLAVVDASSGGWGHINLDHVIHTSDYPADMGGANQPLWGFADTHAHAGNHLGFKSLGGSSQDGYVFHGSPGLLSPATLTGELGSCDGIGHASVTDGSATILAKAEASAFGIASAPGYPALEVLFEPKPGPLSKPTHPNGGYVSPFTPNGYDFEGWPYWWSRTHQQMHVSWLERSYKGGQRLMFAAAGNNEALGSMMRAFHDNRQGYLAAYVSDFGALRRFAAFMKQVAAQNSGWMEIALSPKDARRIIRANKLAIVLATEVDDLGDHCSADLSSTTALASGPDYNFTTTTSTNGANPWNQLKDRALAASCTTSTQWEARVQNLYEVGYRVIMPVHLANNDLGGSALYGGDTFNAMNHFNNDAFFTAASADGSANPVAFKHNTNAVELAWCQFGGCAAGAGSAWALFLPGLSQFALTKYTPLAIAQTVSPAYPASLGHVNTVRLQSNGVAVLNAAKARGMLIDIAHLDRLGRDKVLGMRASIQSSVVASTVGCDMSTPACQEAAYPAIATHAGLYAISGETNENDLEPEAIAQIRAIGGTIAVGTSANDSKSTGTLGGSSQTGIYAQKVANTCGGSSRTFAQGYVYALRAMGGRGVTLGTDINGLEAQLNPRFGTLGCYQRGNVPWVLQYARGNNPLVSTKSWVPYRNRKELLSNGLANTGTGTAGAQRKVERALGKGLNYAHYAGTPPNMFTGGLKFIGLWDSPGYENYVLTEGWVTQQTGQGVTDVYSMDHLSTATPLNASTTGNRTFDFNYDGLAHYGMLPDLLQDTLAVGMDAEQLGPLFQSAEYLVQAWEKSCRLSTAGVNAAGCN